jgi:hypothetical protein
LDLIGVTKLGRLQRRHSADPDHGDVVGRAAS